MEPPLKRPRLSLFQNMDPDPELDQARMDNDMLLKNRFEAIFEKYAHDFDGIGDIVDLNTGKIEQDNGHLRGIDSEKDTGQSRSRSPKPEKLPKQSPNGRSLLRAMTVAPIRDDSYFDDDNADDVIQSIETIAENATVSDEEGAQSADDSDAELFDINSTHQISTQYMDDETPLTSDVDSLFEVVDESKFEEHDNARFSSPDSLFGRQTPSSAAQQNAIYVAAHSSSADRHKIEPSGADDEFNEQAIYAKFGARVGKEVLQLIEKRDMAELHIDPAWRIPVDAQPPRPPSSTSSHDTIIEEPPAQELKNDSSPRKGMSIWLEGTRRTGSRFAPRAKAASPVREESLDPLQEGFHSEDDSEDETELERCNEVAYQGVCPYCQEQYVDRVGVMQHMNREAKFIQRGKDRGEHDPEHIVKLIDYIHEQAKRRNYGKRPGPRLAMCDYKSIVELHEGGGYSFQEIIEMDSLMTLKSDPELLAYLYFRWRDIEDVCGLDGKPSKEWSKAENKIIKTLLNSQKTRMEMFKRKLPKRSLVEIGNKLADKWLTELHTGKLDDVEDEPEKPIQPRSRTASKSRKKKTPSPMFDTDVSEDEYRPERQQRPQKKRKRRSPSPVADDCDDDDDESPAVDLPSQSFDQTFLAATGMTPILEPMSGLPPMPQSVVRNAARFDAHAWPVGGGVADQHPDEDDLYVPTIWA